MVLTSKDNEIFAALPGRPVDDPTWEATTQGVIAALQRAERKLRFSSKRDRRGRFKTIASGVSYGGGQKVSNTVSLVNLVAYRHAEARKPQAQQVEPSGSGRTVQRPTYEAAHPLGQW